MFDYSFFALMFALATSLAPEAAPRVTLENARHPEQTMTWTRGGDGRWAMTINGRDMGHFERVDGAVLHHRTEPEPERFELGALVDPEAIRPASAGGQIPLRGRFAPATLSVRRRGGHPVLRDPTGRLLGTELLVRWSDAR